MPRWQFWNRVATDEPGHACPPLALKFAGRCDCETWAGALQFDVVGFEERIAFDRQAAHGESVPGRSEVVCPGVVGFVGWFGTGN